MHVKKGDLVTVISGKHTPKKRAERNESTGPFEVIDVDHERNRVTLKDVNVRTVNLRRTQESPKGGQIRKEFPLHASNVLLWDAEKKKGVRTRVEGEGRAKTRVSVASGKPVGDAKAGKSRKK